MPSPFMRAYYVPGMDHPRSQGAEASQAGEIPISKLSMSWMGDETRNGQNVRSREGRCREFRQGPGYMAGWLF